MKVAGKSSIHIAHVVYSFATGGLENGVVNLINRLPRDKYRHTVVCVTDHDAAFFSRITAGNTSIVNLNKPPGKGLGWLLACWKLFFRIKPDICHTRNLSALEAQIAAFMSGVSYRIHGEHGWDITDIGGVSRKNQMFRKILKPLVNEYVALSLESVEYLQSKIKVKREKINHICNGVDVNKFTTDNHSSVLPQGFSDSSSIIFGTVGRLAEVKNQTFLLEAFLQLWKNNAHVQTKLKLVIVGEGVLLDKLKTMLIGSGAINSVWFAGRRSDVADVMKQLDVFVLPSLAEGISNTLLEAMATGLPIIATNVGGNEELMLPAHKLSHIVAVNNVDELTKAMSLYINEQLKKESEVVRKHCIENFSLETMVNKYHDLYQNNKLKKA